MRKRSVQILFRLNEEEAEYLYELVRKSGRSKEAFLREMVKGYQLCEKPDPEFSTRRCSVRKQGSGTIFSLMSVKSICFPERYLNGGV